jgi:hypothetical protein
MAQFLRLILIALVLALSVPAPGAQAGTEAALWSQTLTEPVAHGDPPEGVRSRAPALPAPPPHLTGNAAASVTPCPQTRHPAPEARGPPHA